MFKITVRGPAFSKVPIENYDSFKFYQFVVEFTLITIAAYCTVPVVAHAHVVQTENCPNERCIPGSGVVYISCDHQYYPAGVGRLICAGYNKFRTPIPKCLGITQIYSSFDFLLNCYY